jgi:hypothetical protein
VTIHYEGKVASPKDAAAVTAAAAAFAKARHWNAAVQERGVVIQPHEWSEPVELLFDGRVLRPSFVKTQFAGAETHIAVVELFRSLKPLFESLQIEDEADYWDHSDRERLLRQIQETDFISSRIQAEEPGVKGPLLLPGGRIVDLWEPQGADIPAGATVLRVPSVSPRPWADKVPVLDARPPGAWRTFRAKVSGFSVSLPGRPERIASKGLVTYSQESPSAAGLAFTVTADSPEARRGTDPRRLAQSFVWGFRGRLLWDERGTAKGVPCRSFEAEDGARRLFGRVVLSPGRLYFLTVSAKHAAPAEEDVRTFFESFSLLPGD